MLLTAAAAADLFSHVLSVDNIPHTALALSSDPVALDIDSPTGLLGERL